MCVYWYAECVVWEMRRATCSVGSYVSTQTPTADWAMKYLGDGTPLPPEKVAKYGMQILEVSRMGLLSQHLNLHRGL